MEKTSWKVGGMTCGNCALTISKFLEKKGFQDVHINVLNGELNFDAPDTPSLLVAKKGIQDLGYKIIEPHQDHHHHEEGGSGLFSNDKKRFFFTLPFTAILMMHMLSGRLHIHWLTHPYVQLSLCLPVFVTGLWFFGRSAYKSVLNGMPNMNTLITIGSLASFIYSVFGMMMNLGSDYLFFETTAAIICLVFLGNYLEEISVNSTQKALRKLATSQKVLANLIAFDDQQQEQIFQIDNSQLKSGDLVLIKNGEKIPADCKILWGEGSVNESIITGESIPVFKKQKDLLIGGSILEQGTLKAQVTAASDKTILAGILHMVNIAQSEKPPVQKMADKISAIFVPVVICLALITFLLNFYLLHQDSSHALMRTIAVLVIACPCAMGIATPAGIAVGIGRAARSGILFRKPSALESFKKIEQVVFDKTGTLTTGKFIIASYHTSIDDKEFKQIVFSIEKYSSHPMAKAICKEWITKEPFKWRKIEELKGLGISAEDEQGNVYEAGSLHMLPQQVEISTHNIYIVKNKMLLGWIDLKDEIRPEAKEVINWLHKQKIKTILLSGDRKENCIPVAEALNIDQVMAEQLPADKLRVIAELSSKVPTAMVGDGINDAPALAKATLGISLSEASQIAMQNADVVLMSNGLKQLPLAMGLGKHTFRTIKQNLFWAFFYNIIAIPIAAFGFLTPAIAALAMGFSDVILAINSIRLFVKKVF